MLAAIPVTLMISRYFLRMHRYLVDGQTPDDEGRGEQEARIKQEKHLKEHILQQSREARCLVMSFDTLEAPPALPAVSADSGSHDLARIIPTSVVRRIGVDDPKLPTGKESPFRQMVVPKPAGAKPPEKKPATTNAKVESERKGKTLSTKAPAEVEKEKRTTTANARVATVEKGKKT
ncbi:hypothetical protein HPB51_029797 [Rhipicephalus microplus]|uniref:Uncharacterized protein n=1 Tax=Rhipicephalus microplus TaxID=6941 RepID=A0A9J6CSY0_RHIMP|nr:hypothetical protein HPB51_029797 [Rhipicephalus microplus]